MNYDELITKYAPVWPYPINYGKENVATCDVLILGGGVAGCHAAINAAKLGVKVIIVDKGPIRRSGCSGAGVDHWHAACTNPCCKITPEEMVEEHESFGGYSYGELGNGISCYITSKEGWDALQDVEKMGVAVRDINDEFVGAEFRDNKTKLMFAYDYENKHIIRIAGGGNIKPAMYEEVKRLGIGIFDFVMATSLLTEGGKQGARVIGATGVNVRTGEFYVFKAKATFLSMGSANTLWTFSTETRGAFSEPTQTGDGSAMAWRVGAEFSLLEKSGTSSGGLGYIPHTVGNPHNSWFACSIVDANGREVPWVDRDGRLLNTLSERYKLAPGQKFFIQVRGSPYELREPMLIQDLPERIRKGEYVLPLYADLPGMSEKERGRYMDSWLAMKAGLATVYMTYIPRLVLIPTRTCLNQVSCRLTSILFVPGGRESEYVNGVPAVAADWYVTGTSRLISRAYILQVSRVLEAITPRRRVPVDMRAEKPLNML